MLDYSFLLELNIVEPDTSGRRQLKQGGCEAVSKGGTNTYLGVLVPPVTKALCDATKGFLKLEHRVLARTF